MNPLLQDLMRDATRLTRSGQLSAATAAIQRALGGVESDDAQPRPATAAPSAVIEGCVFEVTDAPPVQAPSTRPFAKPARPDAPGEFVPGSHTHASLTRAYKLYVPAGSSECSLPLVVMLHGCTQDPDDFAAGTAMNAAAHAQGFYVLYPAQGQEANASRCWNWFKHNHQARGRGEVAVIADMAQAVIHTRGADRERVYIAGLSAGGAMASLVAAAYPDVFAAVGVHSGLPPGAASSLPQGLAAMRGSPQATASLAVPVIVFHGDQDQTVHPRNGEQVIAAALKRAPRAKLPIVEHGISAGGQRYTRSIYPADGGPAEAEHWLVHGAGHAWSGGQAAGSYTDARGPDATREMLRFFFSHSRRASP